VTANLYHRLVLAIRSTEPRQTRLYMRGGRTVAAIHWWPVAGMVEIDTYDTDGHVARVEAHDAATLRAALATNAYSAPWARTAKLLLSSR
jgi:L-serine deaminase